MNIGMILDGEFPPDSRVENEAKQLIKAGHSVFLFCLAFSEKELEENIDQIQIFRYKFSKLLYDKLSPLAYTIGLYHFLLNRKISHFLKRVDFDAIHIHDIVVAKSVLDSKALPKIPIHLDLHENRPEIMKTYSHVNSLLGKILISIKKWEKKQNEIVKKVNGIIVVTELAKEDLIQTSGIDTDKVSVFPNFIDLKTFSSYSIDLSIVKRFKQNFTVLYVGSTGIRRGLDSAILAIAELKNQIPNIKLVIVGKSRDDEILMQSVARLNLDKFVQFEGWQNLDKFPSYIEASSICISPLTKNKHHDTTYANKIFQYMALGKAIVVSDVKAQAEIVEKEKCGLVHKASDYLDLADKILCLYRDTQKTIAMGQNGIKAVKSKYNAEVASKELLSLYANIKSGHENG